jgi:hypothetical protein
MGDLHPAFVSKWGFLRLAPAEARARISETQVVNRKRRGLKRLGGANTVDKIFLLSESEAKKYFGSNAARRADDLYGEDCMWWLRSPGIDNYHAATNEDLSAPVFYGQPVFYWGAGVRPALWLKL